MNQSDPQDSIPAGVIRASDYAQLAQSVMGNDVAAYINGGAGDELTLAANLETFDRIKLVPRVLGDFSSAGTGCSVLGQAFSAPMLLGPVAYQKLVHPRGELASVEAAEVMGCGFVSSTLSSFSMEQVAEQTGSGKWFQLYWQAEREAVLALVRRAEYCGYRALVVTVDVPVTALRYREQASGFQLPAELTAVNLAGLPESPALNLGDEDSPVLHGLMSQAPKWSDLEWLRRQTNLPILVKGILHPEDAVRAKDCGLQGVIVSNHGGRSLDGLPAAISMLPDIRAAVGEEYTVLLDSGIRRGSDVFKALALGADAVLIGRLQIYALAVAGALGVAHMLRLLVQELEVNMALAGCPTIESITTDSVRIPSS